MRFALRRTGWGKRICALIFSSRNRQRVIRDNDVIAATSSNRRYAFAEDGNDYSSLRRRSLVAAGLYGRFFDFRDFNAHLIR